MALVQWEPYFIEPEEGTAFFDGIVIRSDPLASWVPQRIPPILEEDIAVCRALGPIFDDIANRGGRVLVADAGNGVFAVAAAKRGCRVVAVTSNSRAVWMIAGNAAANGVAE